MRTRWGRARNIPADAPRASSMTTVPAKARCPLFGGATSLMRNLQLDTWAATRKPAALRLKATKNRPNAADRASTLASSRMARLRMRAS